MCAWRTTKTLDKNSLLETKQGKIKFFIKAIIVVNKLLSQAIFVLCYWLFYTTTVLSKGLYKRVVKCRLGFS
ncbi:hypothetical protein DB41_HY00330 [Neochlamydia sp. TUME1]|nr:hypothetical protein DB41_HY00330 [Neochlamydia sp. TUME1]